MKTSSKIISAVKSEGANRVKIIRLENGARIIFDPLPYIKSATIGIWVNIGTRHEQDDQNGIAHLLEHMVFKGAGNRNAQKLAEDAEARGVYLNASTSYERTGFYARCLGEDADFAFDLCADLAFKPHLDENDFGLEKNVVLHEINEAFDDAEDRANVLNQMASFDNQALGRPILGDEASLMAITHNQLVNFHNQYFDPKNLVIGFGGAIDENKMLEKAIAAIGHLKSSNQIIQSDCKVSHKSIFETRKIEQLQLVLSMYAPKANDYDPFGTQVLSAILGGGMASRLFQDLREKRGLVYGIDCYPERYIDVGRLNISAGTHAKSAKEVIARTLGHIEDLAINGPSENEFLRAKKTIETSIMMSLENSSSRLSAAINQICALDNILSIDDITLGIKNIKAEDIKSLASQALESNYRASSGVGKSGQKEIEDFLIC
ncbi:MAG: insulinase family protein [Caulobacterales bacterium]|nr:insulinase family protein [Caulobacterales bacterium]MCA0372343.1 insulinase family protein [Pseudomonadota bacterium]